MKIFWDFTGDSMGLNDSMGLEDWGILGLIHKKRDLRRVYG